MNHIEFNPNAINASDCISNGWQLAKQNFGLYLGISLVAMILMACIPCVSIFLAGPILGGIYIVFLKGMRGESVEFGTMFKGFENFVPLMVIGIVEAIPEIIGQGVRFSLNFRDFGSRSADSNLFQSDPTSGILAGGLTIFILILGLLIFVLAIAFRITFYFAIPLAAERNLDVSAAIKLSAKAAWSNVGGLFLLFILEFFVALAGFIAFCIGIFFVMPIIYAANAFAYRKVFPDTNQPVSYSPPSPDAYGGTYGTGQ